MERTQAEGSGAGDAASWPAAVRGFGEACSEVANTDMGCGKAELLLLRNMN